MQLSKKVKILKTAFIVLVCMALNYAGKELAAHFELPVWLDAFGTVISAYLYGPLCGAITGISVNFAHSFYYSVKPIYALTSAAIGIIVGLASERKKLSTLFGVSTVSVIVTLSSVIISVPLNVIFWGGMTGNVWGDGVISYLREARIPEFVCVVLGEFYVDFLDKIFTMVCVFAVVCIMNNLKKNGVKNPFTRKNLSIVALFAVFAFVPAIPVDASDYDTYIQTVYSSENGLPCGEANDIVQTGDGILWIGTYAGLYRYNGSSFKLMSGWPSVRGVNSLYVDEEGRLWIGTNDKGLSIVINERVVNVIDSEKGLPADSVRSIVRSSDGIYYVGTSAEMAVITLNSGLKISEILKDVSFVSSLSAGKNGFVAAVSASGTLCLLRDKKLVWNEKLSGDQEIYTECYFGNDGKLYAGTSLNKVYSFEVDFATEKLNVRKTGCKECKSLKHIKSLYSYGDKLFVCADNGIGYFNENGFNIINLKEFNNSIDNMITDYQGNLWFTSSRQGLLRLSLSSFKNLYAKFAIDPQVVNTVEEWHGSLCFGTDSGLVLAPQKGFKVLHNSLTERFANVRIRCIRKTSDDSLWICTYGKGLFRVSKDGSIRLFDYDNGMTGNRVRVVQELSDSSIVASGDKGISFIRGGEIEKSMFYKKELGAAKILSIEEVFDGYILCGSDGDGLYVLKDKKLYRTINRADGLTSGVVLRTVKASDGGVFIVTSNSLCYMDKDFNVRALNKFPYYNNYDVYPDGKGNVFVSGSAGIYVACEKDVIADDKYYSCIILDSKTGLNSTITANSWNYIDSDNNLYLACGTGVYMVNMNNYMTGKHSYRMKFTSVSLDGNPTSIEQERPFVIKRNVNKIEIYPEIINYTVFEPYVKWYLEGFDSIPVVMPQRELTSVTYTNLPFGKYDFHLAVLDGKDGSEIESIRHTFIKEKNIYDNRYFKFYMIFVALIAVGWFSWFFVHTNFQHILLVQKKELEFARQQVELSNVTVLAIAKAVDAKDENTAQHSQRVSEYSVLIAEELGFSDKEIENLKRAALLHDIGKIGIPDSVLKKNTFLDDSEYSLMKSHVVRGAEILKDFTMFEHVTDGVLYHHEHWDGSGYIKGLKGEEIPLYGRIIGIADAFDAMTANRVYRKKQDIDYVISELKKGRGAQFDPHITDIMLDLINSGKIDLKSLYPDFKGCVNC